MKNSEIHLYLPMVKLVALSCFLGIKVFQGYLQTNLEYLLSILYITMIIDIIK